MKTEYQSLYIFYHLSVTASKVNSFWTKPWSTNMFVNVRHSINFPSNWYKLDTDGCFSYWLANNSTQYTSDKLQILGAQLDFSKLIPLTAIEKQIEASIKYGSEVCNNINENHNDKQPNIIRILLNNGLDPITLQFTKTFTNFSQIDKLESMVDKQLPLWLYTYFRHYNATYALNYLVYATIANDIYRKFMTCKECVPKPRKYIHKLMMFSLKILDWIENQTCNYFGNINLSIKKNKPKFKIPQCRMCFFKANAENIRQNILFTLEKREQANRAKCAMKAGEPWHFETEYFLTQRAINFASGKYQCNQSNCIEKVLCCTIDQKTEISLVYWTNILWHVYDWIMALCETKRYCKAVSICNVLLQHWIEITKIAKYDMNIMKRIQIIDKENHSVLYFLFDSMINVSVLTNNWQLFDNIKYLLNEEFKCVKSNEKIAAKYHAKIWSRENCNSSQSSIRRDRFTKLVNEMFSKHFNTSIEIIDSRTFASLMSCYNMAREYYTSKWKNINTDIYNYSGPNVTSNKEYAESYIYTECDRLVKMNTAYLKLACLSTTHTEEDCYFLNNMIVLEKDILNKYTKTHVHGMKDMCTNYYNFSQNVYPYLKSSLNIMPVNSNVLVCISKIVLFFSNDYELSLYYLRCAKHVSNIRHQFHIDGHKTLNQSIKHTILDLMKKIWYAMNRLGYNHTQLTCCNATCRKQAMFTPYQLCSGCHAVQYCSRKCQKMDWKIRHGKICLKKFAKMQLQQMSTDEHACLQDLEITLKQLALNISQNVRNS